MIVVLLVFALLSIGALCCLIWIEIMNDWLDH